MRKAQRFTSDFPGLRPFLILAVLFAGCTILLCTKAEAAFKRSEYFPVDGAKLYLLVRGADTTASVLLWLHGGPGGAERPLFRYFNGDLEKHFVVVYWDQRGAGRSFDPKADPHRLKVAQHLADLDVIVDHLRGTLGKDKIVILGHSWGATLGLLYMQAHPEKVSAFIGVNPMISLRAAEESEYDFVLREASRHKDTHVLERARKIGRPPFESARKELAVEKLVQHYGGIFHNEPNRVRVVCGAIFTGLITPWEIARIIHGNNVSLEAMNQELLVLNLTGSVRSLDVPVLFFLGRYDHHVDARIAAAYLADLRAPIKQVVWFENSAHNVPFEEPGLFNAAVVRELQSLGLRTAG